MISVTQSYMSSWLPTLNFHEQPLTQNQGDRLFDVVVQAAEEIFGIDNKTAVRLAIVVRSVCTHEDPKDYELTFSEEEILFSCTIQQMYAFGAFMKKVGQGITRTAAGVGGAVKSISREGGRKLNVTANKINRLTHAGSKHLGATVNNRVYNNEGLWSRMKSGFKTAAEIKGAKQGNLNGINNVIGRGRKIGSKPSQSVSTAANAKITTSNPPATTTQKPTTPATPPKVDPAPSAKPQNPNANSLKDKVHNFGKGFTDQKNGFMGVKGGFKGVGEWAKNNKGQAAVAAVGTAAAAYGAYRMLRPKQQQPQQTNVTVVNKQQ